MTVDFSAIMTVIFPSMRLMSRSTVARPYRSVSTAIGRRMPWTNLMEQGVVIERDVLKFVQECIHSTSEEGPVMGLQ